MNTWTKRGIMATIAGAAVLTLVGCASGTPETGDADAANEVPEIQAPLPQNIQDRGNFIIGVNCDYPPGGYVALDGEPAGYEIEIAKRIEEIAFGSAGKIDTQCVNNDNRISFLQSGKIDFLLASLAYTEERAEQVDYTDPIWVSNLQLVVPKDSDVESYADAAEGRIITSTGSTYQTWLEGCYPEAELILTQNVVDGTTSLKQGRGDAFAYVDVYNYNFVQNNPEFRVVGDLASPAIQGIGVKKGNSELLSWLNEVIETLRMDDYFYQAFDQAIEDKEFVAKYRDVVPGPELELEYATVDTFACK